MSHTTLCVKSFCKSMNGYLLRDGCIKNLVKIEYFEKIIVDLFLQNTLS